MTFRNFLICASESWLNFEKYVLTPYQTTSFYKYVNVSFSSWYVKSVLLIVAASHSSHCSILNFTPLHQLLPVVLSCSLLVSQPRLRARTHADSLSVCAIASRYYVEKSEIYPIAMHFAKHSAANALIDGWKSVELCQAYILMSIYAVPARRWEEDRSWLYTGLAIRCVGSTHSFVSNVLISHQNRHRSQSPSHVISQAKERKGGT